MVGQVYRMSVSDDRTVEKVIQDENLHYMHVILRRGEGLPAHHSNATVYMSVLRGTLSIDLAQQGARAYNRGVVLKIPFDTHMVIENRHEDVLEFTIVKAPAPQA
jgi:quercetin dioxygenase-like cupin family protein